MRRSRWLACVATVEWRAGGRGDEEPLAIRFGSRRLVVSVEERRVVGEAVAGSPQRRVFVVRDERGGRWRVVAAEGGETRVARCLLLP